MDQWYLGTMGFGYKDWQGVFYPPGVSTGNFLSHYSHKFNAVELDTTFYGTPRIDTVQRWLSSVDTGFKFCAKTPRAITHEMGLVGAEGMMVDFIERMQLLEDKLGAILIQLPPRFSAENFPALIAFLKEIPHNVPIAVEFRNRSWYTEMTAELLTKHNICWAATEFPKLPRQVPPTADFLYIRWIGQHGSYDKHTYERVDKTEELKWWGQHIHTHLDHVHSVYGFFNNDYAGFAAGTCQKFKRILGLPTEEFQLPQQGRLF